jgi:hypothetical protein
MTFSAPLLSSFVSNEHLFQATAITLPAWLLLIVAPRWRVSHATAYFTMGLLSLIYVLLLVNPIQTQGVAFFEQFLNFNDVVKMFKTPEGVVVGWYVRRGGKSFSLLFEYSNSTIIENVRTA